MQWATLAIGAEIVAEHIDTAVLVLVAAVRDVRRDQHPRVGTTAAPSAAARMRRHGAVVGADPLSSQDKLHLARYPTLGAVAAGFWRLRVSGHHPADCGTREADQRDDAGQA